MELYKKHRPKSLSDVVGQESAVRVLETMVKEGEIPHAILLSGPSGCGKTTIARILRKHLKCKPEDFRELNIADIRGVDNIRDIRTSMRRYAIGGGAKVWMLDEVSELTGTAQKALLKMLEDTPDHVWFMLATTDPQKLIKPIRTRCTEIALKPIGEKELDKLIRTVATDEERCLEDSVYTKIVECSDGSARKALVLLDSIIHLETEEQMLEAIEKSSQEKQAINLCRLLLSFRPSWPDIAKLLRELEGEDAEGLRRMVLGYMRSVVLGGGKMTDRAYAIQCCFERNFFDTGNAGLQMACWEACHGK